MKKLFFVTLFVVAWIASLAQLNTNHVIHTGRSRLYLGNYTGSIESFNMVIKMSPHLPEPYFYRGVAKQSLEDYRGALVDLNEAIEIKPYYPDAFLYRGVVYYHLKEFEKAMDDYSKAMELGGENADVYNNRGICKAGMHDMEGAIADYTKSIELKAKNFNAYLNRSMAYQLQKEWDKAIADCNQLVRIKPNSPMGYLSRGLIKIEKEDYAGALRDFDMAIYVDPKDAFAYQNRGLVKQQLESYESAIMDYDMAIMLDNRMASAYFNRGMAREILGREGYQKDYDTASLIDPRFSKRPWQTEEEKEEGQRQQMQAWQNQMQQKQNKAGSNVLTTTAADSTLQTSQKDTKPNTEIDYDDLMKRKMKANLVVADNREIPGDAEEADKGYVQNQNINIELLPMFTVTSLNKRNNEQVEVGYFSLILENLNTANNFDPYLTISNQKQADQESMGFYKNQILLFDERIRQNSEVATNYLYRGVFRALTNQLQEAIDDCDKVIKLEERNLLAYFLRANIRFQMIETIEQVKMKMQTNKINATPTGFFKYNPSGTQSNMEAFDDISTDYSVVLYMNPDFYFAYFNRGNIYCKSEGYAQAIDEYTKAIAIEPEFAEAYYNRGLVKILLNDVEGGARDLSRAGELGIEQSYNVIKRYCN